MTPNEARQQAHRILSRPPYSTPPHRAGFLTRNLSDIGRWVQSVFHWLGKVFHPVGHGVNVAFGDLWPIPVAAVLVILGLLGARLVVRVRASREAGAEARRGQSDAATIDDPRALELLADEAEASGQFTDAVRLRYRAGLAALARAGLLSDRADKTDRVLAGELGSPSFRRLAEIHEAVTFADQTATAQDAAAVRAIWPQVAPEARRHSSEHERDVA